MNCRHSVSRLLTPGSAAGLGQLRVSGGVKVYSDKSPKYPEQIFSLKLTILYGNWELIEPVVRMAVAPGLSIISCNLLEPLGGMKGAAWPIMAISAGKYLRAPPKSYARLSLPFFSFQPVIFTDSLPLLYMVMYSSYG